MFKRLQKNTNKIQRGFPETEESPLLERGSRRRGGGKRSGLHSSEAGSGKSIS